MGIATDSSTKEIADDVVDDTLGEAEPGEVKSSAAKQSARADELLETEAADSDSCDEPGKPNGKARRVSISLRALAVGIVVVGLIAALGVMTWLYLGANRGFDAQARLTDNSKHAEKVALDYAVNAAIMDYKDLGPWKQNIVKGTTPELTDKLTKAATAMEQIVLPLQWTSTAKPLAAKVRSENNGVYIVDAFVSVMTKTVQSADALQSTATYSVTIDSNNAWRITDVGGIASVVDK
jgi:hypothetical protein